MSSANIDQWRADTPGCHYKKHFNNAGASLPPAAVNKAIRAYLDLEELNGGYETAVEYAPVVQRLYDKMAQYLHCAAHNIAFCQSATDGYARALSAIPFRLGDVILTTDSDYVSNQLAFLSLQKRFGIQIRRVSNGDNGLVDPQAIREAALQYKPVLIAVTHIPTNAGFIQPIEAIGAICAEMNILYLVDACQSAGQLPLDTRAIQCDFLTATFRKFMRGPRGMGFLYISDKVLQSSLEPLFHDLRGSRWITADDYTNHRDARLFEYWEFSYALLAGCEAAINYLLQTGIDVIAKRNAELCAYTRTQLGHLGFLELLDHAPHLSSIIPLHQPGADPEAIKQFLAGRHINTSISYRGSALLDFTQKKIDWALRISPHYYNTETEVNELIVALTAWGELRG